MSRSIDCLVGVCESIVASLTHPISLIDRPTTDSTDARLITPNPSHSHAAPAITTSIQGKTTTAAATASAPVPPVPAARPAPAAAIPRRPPPHRPRRAGLARQRQRPRWWRGRVGPGQRRVGAGGRRCGGRRQVGGWLVFKLSGGVVVRPSPIWNKQTAIPPH